MIRVAVIGGGVSGIAAAHALANRGVRADLFEAAPTLGGRVSSTLASGRRLDLGGKNIGLHYHRFRRFVTDLGGLAWEPFGLNTSTVVDGRLVAIDRSRPHLHNLVALLRLCGPGGIARLVPLARAIRRDPDQGFLDSPYFHRLSERADPTLAAFFNGRCVEHFIRPLTVRMNGAEPHECHLGNFGSNLGLVLDNFEQLRDGMHALFERFVTQAPAHGVRVLTGRRVNAISPKAAGPGGQVAWESDCGAGAAEYDRILVALPAGSAAALLGSGLPGLARLLREVVYSPVAVAVAGYQRPVFRSDCRAMVFARDSPLSNAGAYGGADLNLVRYTFSGAAARKVVTERHGGVELADIGESIAAPWLDLAANARESVACRYLAEGLCAYSAQHADRLAQMRAAAAAWEGLGLCGDYWRGASIEACFRAAEEAVTRLLHGQNSRRRE